MNMYTSPDYRRKGIAYHTLELLMEEIKKRESNIFHWKRRIWEDRCMRNMDL